MPLLLLLFGIFILFLIAKLVLVLYYQRLIYSYLEKIERPLYIKITPTIWIFSVYFNKAMIPIKIENQITYEVSNLILKFLFNGKVIDDLYFKREIHLLDDQTPIEQKKIYKRHNKLKELLK